MVSYHIREKLFYFVAVRVRDMLSSFNPITTTVATESNGNCLCTPIYLT